MEQRRGAFSHKLILCMLRPLSNFGIALTVKPSAGPESLDFRLLALFDAVYEHGSFTLAAQKLSMSQPAVSQGMARIRRLLGDPLFVRAAQGLMPTPHAERLIAPVRDLLQTFRGRVLGGSGFTPKTSDREFSCALTDLGAFTLMPRVLAQLHAAAPGVRLRLVSLESGGIAAGLESARVDLAFGPFPKMPGGIFRQRLYDDEYVCLLRPSHPLAKGRLTLRRFADAEHVLVVTEGTGHAFNPLVEQAITAAVAGQRIVLKLPSFTVAAFLVRDADLLLTLPRRAALLLARDLDLKMLPVPLKLKRLEIFQYWHERSHHDAGHRWFRNEIATLFNDGRVRAA